MENKIKTLEYYQRLPYTLYREPQKDSDGKKYWTAEYLELRGCKTEGETEAEAIKNLQNLFDEYIVLRIENNHAIPEPEKMSRPSNEIIILVGNINEGSFKNIPGEKYIAETEKTNVMNAYQTA
jgi:predicted RNase H-like HicB family nuclease